MSFFFRIRFAVGRGGRLNTEQTELKIPLGSGLPPAALKGLHGEPLQEASWLVLTGGPFPSKAEANTAGELMKCCLWWAGLQGHLALDLGADREIGHIAPAFRDLLESTERVRVLGDVHGLRVYETPGDSRPVKFISLTATLSAQRSSDAFALAVGEAWERKHSLLDDKLRLALELYHLSALESSVRARFLLLVTALEVLAIRGKRPRPALQLVEEFIAAVKRAEVEAGAEDKEALRGVRSGLGDLRWQSLTSSLVDLIERCGLNLDQVYMRQRTLRSFVKACYTARSELAHGGATKTALPLNTWTLHLDRLVTEVVAAVAGIPLASTAVGSDRAIATIARSGDTETPIADPGMPN